MFSTDGAPPGDSAPGPPRRAFTVMCVDDNALLVDALEGRLALEAGFAGLHRVTSFTDVPDAVARARPDIVLLDIDLPDGVDAMHVLAEIVRDTPASRVIVFTGYPDGELVAAAMGLGAWGFVSKGVTADRLIHAIRAVLGGDAAIELE